jgi:hypothetical protein
MAVARLRRVAPSELLSIGCDWCAYCLDEALLVRESAHARKESEDRKQEAADDHYDRTGRVKFG